MNSETMKSAEPVLLYDEYKDVNWVPAPCQQECPVGTDAPSYIGMIWEGRLEDALEAITATNPFSSVCGRVCAKPCETKCRRGESDAPVAIRNLKRYVMDRLGPDYAPAPVPVTRKETIGIVGSGPTGLTAAQDLAELGYEVHLYEKSDRLGGMMNVIPAFRLPRKTLEQDISRILNHCPGIVIHLNTGLGAEVSLDELKQRHDAVLLCVGLWKDRKLNVPGELDGLSGLYGINFLTGLSAGKTISLTGKTIVVGGGNVAVDLARTALRAGAQEVELYCLETREEMPAWKHEIEEAEREGIKINNSWGPKRIHSEDGAFSGIEFMRCVSVFDGQGKFNPTYDPDKTMTVSGQSALLAIGLTAENKELEETGLLDRGFVRADFDSMRSGDPKVFAAGDCAFGPSAVVTAMSHGHRASYCINAFLQGMEKPLPYTVPYRTRRVEIAQDPLWEKLPREEQKFLGIGSGAGAMAECEETYDDETAKRQAARCLRCDAETGSANYPRRHREIIHAMARTESRETERLRDIQLRLLRPRENPFPPERPAHIEDLVFLSAALTRLVIDPYREKCSTKTVIGSSLVLQQPFFATGFDDAPQEIRQALASALASKGCGYIGARPLLIGAKPSGDTANADHAWLQLLVPGKDKPSSEADGVVYVLGEEFKPIKPERANEKQLVGLSVAAKALPEAIPYALEQRFDLLVLDGTSGIEKPWVELEGAPDLTVMRDAIRILRKLNQEEEISLVYFGGMRSGTDVAKVLAINCNAAAFGVPLGLSMGGVIRDKSMAFDSGVTLDERRSALERWIKATADETAIIARCTGKTNVHNLEPEDMRSITLATSEALDIPMASGGGPRERF